MKSGQLLIRINSSSQPPDTISLPPEIMSKLKVVSGETLILTAGCTEFNLKISELSNDPCVKVSMYTLAKLGLYNNQSVNVMHQGNKKIKLGPFIGVFVNIGSIKSISNGNPHQRLVELARASISESSILYFFSIRDINWPKKMITGYSYNIIDTTWNKMSFPFPDVLYDRGVGFLAKQVPVARYIRKQFINVEKLQKLNAQHYFNKWINHKALSKHKEMEKYLPETILFDNSPECLKYMLDKYTCLYLKACEGSNGKQVIRVKKISSDKYELNYFDKKVVFDQASSLEEIINKTNKLFNFRSFIIQQGINVLEYQGNNVDMRALLQRNKKGQWQVTAVPVRIAHEHSGITSTSSGSTCYQFDYAFTKLFGLSIKQLNTLKQQITGFLYTLVITIEKDYGKFGEIGIDLALDKQGKLWFIESNSKPGKDTIILSGNEEATKKSFLVPIQYIKFLTGFYDE